MTSTSACWKTNWMGRQLSSLVRERGARGSAAPCGAAPSYQRRPMGGVRLSRPADCIEQPGARQQRTSSARLAALFYQCCSETSPQRPSPPNASHHPQGLRRAALEAEAARTRSGTLPGNDSPSGQVRVWPGHLLGCAAPACGRAFGARAAVCWLWRPRPPPVAAAAAPTAAQGSHALTRSRAAFAFCCRRPPRRCSTRSRRCSWRTRSCRRRCSSTRDARAARASARSRPRRRRRSSSTRRRQLRRAARQVGVGAWGGPSGLPAKP
jgi:hypothetical protein